MPDSDYSLLADAINEHHVGNRTRTVALLAWFLDRVWRVDPMQIDDAICDGGGDKGIDGVLVDEDAKDIVVLQAKHRDSPAPTQGDADLKAFSGVQPYFTGPEGVDALLASAPNDELRKLVERNGLREKLESGHYGVTYVFVTNAVADASAKDYLAAAESSGFPVELWDRSALGAVARRTQAPGLLDAVVELPFPYGAAIKPLAVGGQLMIGIVPANDLVKLPGIADLTLFDLNVRLGLGKTGINKELAATIGDSAEHDPFPAFHNGLTLITGEATLKGGGVELNGVSVVNGCQSLLALYSDRASLTTDLEIVVKVVEAQNEGLIDRITYRSNNQNPVNMRDQRSNDAVQRSLQADMLQRYGTRLFYLIRNGEDVAGYGEVLDNRDAAQLLTAVYRESPRAAVRKIKLFDDDYYDVFTRYVTADRLYLLNMLDQEVWARKSELRDDLRAAFASVRFTLVYLVSEVVRRSELGRQLLEHPEGWLPDQEDAVRGQLSSFANHAIRTINDFVKARETDVAFDFKVAFKSRSGVLDVAREANHIADVLQERVGGFDFELDPTRPV